MENMNVSNQGAIHRKADIATWMGSAHYPTGRDFLCIYSHVIAKCKSTTATDTGDRRHLLKVNFTKLYLVLLKATLSVFSSNAWEDCRLITDSLCYVAYLHIALQRVKSSRTGGFEGVD